MAPTSPPPPTPERSGHTLPTALSVLSRLSSLQSPAQNTQPQPVKSQDPLCSINVTTGNAFLTQTATLACETRSSKTFAVKSIPAGYMRSLSD